MTAGGGSKDFFVSYSGADQAWAEWIAWVLEEAGYTVVLQAWDFRPGSNFVMEMQQAAAQAERTIAVLSPDFLASRFTAREWAAAFARDPTGALGLLLPVRVRECEPKDLLGPFVYIDLVGLTEPEARERLLRGVPVFRAKPSIAPGFPTPTRRVVQYEPLTYPGATPEDPPELIPYIRAFRADHPDARKSAFIMMRFGASKRHDEILRAIRDVLAEHGIEALRADDKAYDDLLMMNLRTYLHGCGFGVAVFDRIESEIHNPNVALEVGYMLALGKRICLLKDRAITRLPSDVIGSLYIEFDMDDILSSIKDSLIRWLKQRGLA